MLSMTLSEKAAQSGARDSGEVMRKAVLGVFEFNLRCSWMLCNGLSYVPHYLLPPSLIPPVPFGDDKE